MEKRRGGELPKDTACSRCKESNADKVCSCTGTEQVFCANCMNSHKKWCMASTSENLGAVRKQPHMELVLCGMCHTASADGVCICTSPSSPLCNKCLPQHMLNDVCLVHSFHPITQVKKLETPAQVNALKDRQQRSRTLRQRLDSALSEITGGKAAIDQYVNELIERVQIAQHHTCQRLDQQETTCNAMVAEIANHLYEEGFQSAFQPVAAIWTGEEAKSDVFELSSAECLSKFKTVVAGTLLHENGKADFADPLRVIPILRYVEGETAELAQYNVSLGLWCASVRLSANLNFNLGSSLIKIDNHSVFLCGANNPAVSTAYIIDCKSGAVHKQKSMSIKRGWAGACLYDAEIYILGGIDRQQSSETEKFSLQRQCWQPLPSMKYARSGFNPCVKGTSLYLAGGDYQTDMEVFDFASQSFSTLPVHISGASYSVLLACDTGFILLQEAKAYTIDFAVSRKQYWKQVEKEVSASIAVPVTHGNSLFIVDKDNELLKIDLTSLAVETIE